MIKIAHRGNINGPNEKYENDPSYIIEAIKQGFDVEIDVWFLNGSFYLGHDNPKYMVGINYLKNDHFWCHCKNIESLYLLTKNNIRSFFHDSDGATLTSDGYIWTYPGEHLTENSICVMPEKSNWKIPKNIAGVCSDYVLKIEEYIK